MPRSAEALPITRILPERLAIIAGKAALQIRGSGSTSAAKTSRHSVSATATASVEGAEMARLATSTSIWPAAAITAAGASALVSACVSAITVAPCSASTAQSSGPMNSPAWVTRMRLPVRLVFDT